MAEQAASNSTPPPATPSTSGAATPQVAAPAASAPVKPASDSLWELRAPLVFVRLGEDGLPEEPPNKISRFGESESDDSEDEVLKEYYRTNYRRRPLRELPEGGPGPSECNIEKLPDEILFNIFSYLFPEDLGWCACVCKKWSSLIVGNKWLWARLPAVSTSVSEAMAVARVLPVLRAIHLFHCGMFGVDVGWPVTALYFPDSFLPQEPYCSVFDSPTIVLDCWTCRNTRTCMIPVKVNNVIQIIVVESLSEPRQCYEDPRRIPSDPLSSRLYGEDKCVRVNEIRTLRRAAKREMKCILGDEYSRLCKEADSFCDVASLAFFQKVVESDDSDEDDKSGTQVSPKEEKGEFFCPSLKIVRVLTRSVPAPYLENLCRLGPVRVLNVESRQLPDLYFLYACRSTLVELIIADCTTVPVEYYDVLVFLKELRKLCLYKCDVPKSMLEKYIKCLPNLKTVEILPQSRFTHFPENITFFTSNWQEVLEETYETDQGETVCV